MRLDELKWNTSYSAGWDRAELPTGYVIFRVTDDNGLFEPGHFAFYKAGPGGHCLHTGTAYAQVVDPITAQALLFHYLGNPEGNQGDVPTNPNQGDYE